MGWEAGVSGKQSQMHKEAGSRMSGWECGSDRVKGIECLATGYSFQHAVGNQWSGLDLRAGPGSIKNGSKKQQRNRGSFLKFPAD